MLIMFVRSFLTESIVVIRSILPIRPNKIKTNASIAPINVTCRVGCLDDCSWIVEFMFVNKLLVETVDILFVMIC